jgi:hypothetical protein
VDTGVRNPDLAAVLQELVVTSKPQQVVAAEVPPGRHGGSGWRVP